MENKLVLSIAALILILTSGTILYFNIDNTKIYYCETKDIYKQCEKLSGGEQTWCYLTENNLNKTIESCGVAWKKVAVTSQECEFNFDDNRAIVNNLIYSLNTPQRYKTIEEIEDDKQLLNYHSECTIAQQNTTNKIEGLEEIRNDLISRNIKVGDVNNNKIIFPELILIN